MSTSSVCFTPKSFLEAYRIWLSVNKYSLGDVLKKSPVKIEEDSIVAVRKKGQYSVLYFREDGVINHLNTRNLNVTSPFSDTIVPPSSWSSFRDYLPRSAVIWCVLISTLFVECVVALKDHEYLSRRHGGELLLFGILAINLFLPILVSYFVSKTCLLASTRKAVFLEASAVVGSTLYVLGVSLF